MKLLKIEPRQDLENRLASAGMSWFMGPTEPTWMEHKAYLISAEAQARIQKGADEILDMVPTAVRYMLGRAHLLDRLGIPEAMRLYLRKTWERGDPDFYGRLDFGLGADGNIKLYEYNADTSACLWEALAVTPQWWEESGCAQLSHIAAPWNDLGPSLAQTFRETPLCGGHIIFTSPRNNDERMKGALALQPAAQAAGYSTSYVNLEDLQLRGSGFADLAGHQSETLFKVYFSWERIMHTPLGAAIAAAGGRVIEPFWKVLVQNKLFPAILWDLNPGHPNLLETYLEDDPRAKGLEAGGYARKTIFGREGKNVELTLSNGERKMTTGPYASAGWVRQALAPLPEIDGRHPMLGIWTARGKSCGAIVRESAGLITLNESPVIPILVEKDKAAELAVKAA